MDEILVHHNENEQLAIQLREMEKVESQMKERLRSLQSQLE